MSLKERTYIEYEKGDELTNTDFTSFESGVGFHSFYVMVQRSKPGQEHVVCITPITSAWASVTLHDPPCAFISKRHYEIISGGGLIKNDLWQSMCIPKRSGHIEWSMYWATGESGYEKQREKFFKCFRLFKCDLIINRVVTDIVPVLPEQPRRIRLRNTATTVHTWKVLP